MTSAPWWYRRSQASLPDTERSASYYPRTKIRWWKPSNVGRSLSHLHVPRNRIKINIEWTNGLALTILPLALPQVGTAPQRTFLRAHSFYSGKRRTGRWTSSFPRIPRCFTGSLLSYLTRNVGMRARLPGGGGLGRSDGNKARRQSP